MLAHHYLAALELRPSAGGRCRSSQTGHARALREAGTARLALNAFSLAAQFSGKHSSCHQDETSGHPHFLSAKVAERWHAE